MNLQIYYKYGVNERKSEFCGLTKQDQQLQGNTILEKNIGQPHLSTRC